MNARGGAEAHPGRWVALLASTAFAQAAGVVWLCVCVASSPSAPHPSNTIVYRDGTVIWGHGWG
jgi:hypothetical protein